MFNIIESNTLTGIQKKEIRDLEDISNSLYNLKNHAYLTNEMNYYPNFPCFYLGYLDNVLVSFISIFSPTIDVGEISATVHPNYERKKYFYKLLQAAKLNLQKFNINNVLYVFEENSTRAKEIIFKENFLNNLVTYDHTEYRLEKSFKKEQQNLINPNLSFKIVDNTNFDSFKKIVTSLYSDLGEDSSFLDVVISDNNCCGYLGYLKDIPVSTFIFNLDKNIAFLYGFGVLEDYQNQGFGKETLSFAINTAFSSKKKIILDVDSFNNRAFNLYKLFDFKIIFQTNYYRIKTIDL